MSRALRTENTLFSRRDRTGYTWTTKCCGDGALSQLGAFIAGTLPLTVLSLPRFDMRVDSSCEIHNFEERSDTGSTRGIRWSKPVGAFRVNDTTPSGRLGAARLPAVFISKRWCARKSIVSAMILILQFLRATAGQIAKRQHSMAPLAGHDFPMVEFPG